MIAYITKRILLTFPVIIAVSILVFGAVRVIPGDVCRLLLNAQDTSLEPECDSINHALGLDRPVVAQYVRWSGLEWFVGGPEGVLQADFSNSIVTRQPVSEEIVRRMPVTLEITLLGMAFGILVGIPAGVGSAIFQNKWPDNLLRLVMIGWLSVPALGVATMLITFPAKWWGYGPPLGYENIWKAPLTNLEQLYLPAISIGLALSAGIARYMRSALLEVLRQDYIRTARAKGLAPRTVIFGHALKNGILPVVTLLGVQLGGLLSGTVIVERIFGLPGLGTLTVNSVLAKDYPTVQAIVLVTALIIVMVNLVIDISYAWLDPRVKYS
jgi:peptide/nickel transport system permease protein